MSFSMRSSGGGSVVPRDKGSKAGRLAGLRERLEAQGILFPAVGLLSLVWFLVRVIPKPSRAAYPCQKVAAPLAIGFVAWLAGASGAGLALRYGRDKLRQARWLAATVALLVAAAGLGWAALGPVRPARATLVDYPPHPVNDPIGVARGLMPGRVAWAHNPPVTDWDGTANNASESWFNHIDQGAANDLVRWALTGYAGTSTTDAAWDAIFAFFNGGDGYQPGEKVFIKVNLVTSLADACADESYNWVPSACGASWSSVGQSPQLVVALLDQLVTVVGVAQPDITVGDSTGLWVNELYTIVHDPFPDVVFMDARGTLGRSGASRSATRLYWSTDEANDKDPDYLLQAVVDARYMINLAVLKSHAANGITVTAKNHFGSLSGGNDDERKPFTENYYNIHLRLPLIDDPNAWPLRGSMAQYRPLVDLNGHTGMGGKTLLYLIDGIFGGEGWDGAPSKWAMAPFNNNWPASLFRSMDQVAIDSVAFDFLSEQWPNHALGNEGVQDYMHEMALAGSPPSGTFYDPENDGTAMASQGVHEHWNNAADKQYTRNLGTGSGIELVYVSPARTRYIPIVLRGRSR
jgi:hypothetical protein